MFFNFLGDIEKSFISNQRISKFFTSMFFFSFFFSLKKRTKPAQDIRFKMKTLR